MPPDCYARILPARLRCDAADDALLRFRAMPCPDVFDAAGY